MSFDRGDRTYYLSDERMRAFQALSVEARLRWVEEFASFVREAQAAMRDEATARWVRDQEGKK